MHCVDLGESFQTHIYLQNFVSIQPRTSPVKFAASRDNRPRARFAETLEDIAHNPALWKALPALDGPKADHVFLCRDQTAYYDKDYGVYEEYT